MKNHDHVPLNSTSREVIHETIAARAYELWLRDGQPGDRAEANWLEAEHELVTLKYEGA
jgi:hypothetical protein